MVDEQPPGRRWSAPDPDIVGPGQPAHASRPRLTWPRGRRGLVSALAAAGAVAGVVVGGVSVAGSSPASSATVASAASSPGPDGYGHGRGGGTFGGFLGALHGQFVTPRSGGGYQTVDIQRGKVTALSGGTITVRSDDGYTRTYAVGSGTTVNGGRDGIGSVKKGDDVLVVANDGGNHPAATRITDIDRLREPGQTPGRGWEGPGWAGPGWAGPGPGGEMPGPGAGVPGRGWPSPGETGTST
jgi:hypothetical protein